MNGYNPDLLRAWNANMDIQYVLDPFCCIMYMLSYISKPEHEMSNLLKNVIKGVRERDVNEADEMKAHNAGLLKTQASKRSGVCGTNMQLTDEKVFTKRCVYTDGR